MSIKKGIDMFKLKSTSIRTKLILIFISIILFTSVSISLFTFSAAENEIKEKSDELSAAYLNQVVKHFDLLMGNAQDATISLAFNKDINIIMTKINEGTYEDFDYFQKAMAKAMDMFSAFQNANKYIEIINVYDFNNKVIMSSDGVKASINDKSPEYNMIKELYDNKHNSYKEIIKWIGPRMVRLNKTDRFVFTFIMPVRSLESNTVIGFITTYIREDKVCDAYREMSLSGGGRIILVDKNGKVLSSLDKNVIGQEYSVFMQHYKPGNLSSYLENIGGNKYIITYRKSEYNEWGFLLIIPLKVLMRKNFSALQNTFVLISSTTIILAFLVSFVFNFYFYKPIKYLISRIRQHSSDNDGADAMFSRSDEIGFIFKSFNEILVENKELMKNNYEQKLHLKDSEIRLLHSQINPHFLYNSLDAVIWLVKFKKYDDIVNLTNAMVSFFRMSLDKGNEIVTVRRVKEQLESYFVIQKIRYSNRLKVELNFDPSILDCKMLKLLLQPIVENSIYHGIEKKIGECFIRITGVKSGNILKFTIEDNGVGISPERLEEVNRIINSEEQEPGIFYALQNINIRIKLFYANVYGIKLESNLGTGTIVRIVIPTID